MDCVITRLQMEVRMFFSVLGPEKCKEIGKIGEIIWGGRRAEKNLGKMTKKRVVSNSEIFQRKSRNFLCGPRTETKFFKWSATRKRLRTVALFSSPIEHAVGIHPPNQI